jgi:hypothetical protein
MLQDSLFETQRRTKTRKPITVVLSVIAHVVSVAVLVLIPLLQTQALTTAPVDVSLLLPRVENHKPSLYSPHNRKFRDIARPIQVFRYLQPHNPFRPKSCMWMNRRSLTWGFSP